MLVLLSVVSAICGILAVAGLPSAFDSVMFLLLLTSLHAVGGFTVFASIPGFDGPFCAANFSFAQLAKGKKFRP